MVRHNLPDAELVAEASELLEDVAGQMQLGGDITVPVTIGREDFMLLAWLGHKQDMLRRGHIAPLGRPTDFSPLGPDFRRAAEYIADLAHRHSAQKLEKLGDGDDTLLTQPRPRPAADDLEPLPF